MVAGKNNIQIGSETLNKGFNVHVILGIKGGNGIYENLYDYMVNNGITLDPSPISQISFQCFANIYSTDNLFEGKWETTMVTPSAYEGSAKYTLSNPVLTRGSDSFTLAAGLAIGSVQVADATLIAPTTPWLPIDFTQSKWLQ